MLRAVSKTAIVILFFVIYHANLPPAFCSEKKDEGTYRRTIDPFWSLAYRVGSFFKEGYNGMASYFRTESPKIKAHGEEIGREIKNTNKNAGEAFKGMGMEIKKSNEKIIKELRKKD